MLLVWRPEARMAAREIFEYIAKRNLGAAEELYARIESCAERLSDFPYMHRVGRAPGTREVVVNPNYLLIYRVMEDRVEIVEVRHARRRYPET